jgi:WD40 repeat protein
MRLVSGGADWTVRLWNATSGQELRALQGHTNPVWSVAFSPDGAQLASASGDTVHLWDAVSSQELCTLKKHTNSFYSVAFSPDGARLASAEGGYDARTKQYYGEVKLWAPHLEGAHDPVIQRGIQSGWGEAVINYL